MPSITVEPCTFALFGALGDLALRKLFPALYQLDGAGLLHEDTRIIALARESGSEQAASGVHRRRTAPLCRAKSWTKPWPNVSWLA